MKNERTYNQSVAIGFVNNYYTTMMHNSNLLFNGFYSDRDTNVSRGTTASQKDIRTSSTKQTIVQMLKDYHPNKSNITILSIDWQESMYNSLFIHTYGELTDLTTQETHLFYQTLLLVTRQRNRYYIKNDLFRYIQPTGRDSYSFQLPFNSQNESTEVEEPVVVEDNNVVVEDKNVVVEDVVQKPKVDVQKEIIDLLDQEVDWTEMSDDDELSQLLPREKEHKPEPKEPKRTVLKRKNPETDNQTQKSKTAQKPVRKNETKPGGERVRKVWTGKSTPKTEKRADQSDGTNTRWKGKYSENKSSGFYRKENKPKEVHDPSCSAFVSNLGHLKSSDLEEVLLARGFTGIKNIKIVLPRGDIGYINLYTAEDAESLINAAHDEPIIVHGQTINIQQNKNKNK